MGQYLKEFQSLLKQKQADQVLALLNKQKLSGQITTIQEFTSRLNFLLTSLNQGIFSPTLKLFLANPSDLTDIETFNFMLDRIQDDLKAAFIESNQIDEVLRSHQAIIRDVVLKKLQFGTAEIESKLSLYEFINTNLDGYDTSIFSTFRESKDERTTRSTTQDLDLFRDPRTKIAFSKKEDAYIDPIGERLILGSEITTLHTIRNVIQLFDKSNGQTELTVQAPDMKVSNIIDGKSGTYWSQALLYSNIRPSVNTQLQFELGNTKDVNFLEIEPTTKKGFYLESISYADGNNIIISLPVLNKFINSPTSVNFSTIVTNRIILSFRNEMPIPVEFEYSATDTIHNQSNADAPLGFEASLDNISRDLDELIASQKTKDIIGHSVPSKKTFAGYAFDIGFDNIRFGLNEYKGKSVYTSKALEVKNIGQIGLKAIEGRPFSSSPTLAPEMTEDTYDDASENFFHGSIEYYVILRDFDDKGNILTTSSYPISPLGITRINHERVLLTEKSISTNALNDIGTTRFFTTDTLGNIKLYRNGILLTGADWTDISVAGDAIPDNGYPMKFKFKITQPASGDIFTISYDPKCSNTISIPKTLETYTDTGAVITDLVGDLSARTYEDQRILIADKVYQDKIATSQVFLQIILRQNTANSKLTPAVEEYNLVVGQKDILKFRGFNEQ